MYDFQSQYSPVRPVDPQARPAPFWRRLVARIIDFCIALPLAFVLVVPVTLLFSPLLVTVSGDVESGESGLPFSAGSEEWSENVWGPIGASICLFLAFIALELFLLVNRQGQTLGKGLMKIRVVRVDGRPLRVRDSAVRLLLLFLLNWFWHSINVAALFLNVIAVTADRKRRRAVHDYAARTRVVMADRRKIKFADMKLMAPGLRRTTQPPDPHGGNRG